MAPKVPTGNDLLAEFDSLVDSKPTMETAAASKTSIPSRPAKSTTKPKGPAPGAQAGAEVDPLADLEGLAKSRPLTPANGARKSTEISRSGLGEPPTGLTSQGEKTAPVNEKNTSAGAMGVQGETQAKVVPEPPAAEAPQTKGHVTRESVSVSELVQENMGGGGGGWWGGLMGAASAAVKQAEALAKDIQQNEEAQKWAEQMRGNVGALRNYGTFGAFRSLFIAAYTDRRSQARISAPVPFLPSQIFCTLLPRQSRLMNVSKSTSVMTLLATRPLTPSSTKSSPE